MTEVIEVPQPAKFQARCAACEWTGQLTVNEERAEKQRQLHVEVAHTDAPWEYGFYDAAENQSTNGPTIAWYVFGVLTHGTADSALHTARKCVSGQAIIVRRRQGDIERWEYAPGYGPQGLLPQVVEPVDGEL